MCIALIYQNEIHFIEDTINKIAYNLSTNQSQENGIALDIKFQGLNGSFSNFAMRLEDFEISILSEIKALGYTLPSYEALKLKQIIANDLNSVGNDELESVDVEIEDVLKQG